MHPQELYDDHYEYGQDQRKFRQQIILAEDVPKWEKFDAKSYRKFRSRYVHYVMNNGEKSINEITTIECKDQSDMFFEDLFGNTDVNILKMCDKHFRIDTRNDLVRKLKDLAMSESCWYPDIDKYEEYCINFKKVISMWLNVNF